MNKKCNEEMNKVMNKDLKEWLNIFEPAAVALFYNGFTRKKNPCFEQSRDESISLHQYWHVVMLVHELSVGQGKFECKLGSGLI